jgi:NitT/TauT family transport system substrate-binding protein
MRRGTFLAAGAALTGAPAVAGAQALQNIRVAAAPDEDVLGALWGAQSGIFRKYGLAVDVQRANSGSAVAAAVAGGSIDVGKSSPMSLLTAHARGLPFVFEAPASIYSSDAPYAALICAKDAPLRTGRDLNGKTIAVSSLGDLYTVVNSAWIDQNGGDAKTVKWLELPSAAVAEAIAGGRVDAATMSNPILVDALATGKTRILAYSFDAIGHRFVAALYFTTADYATKNADVMSRFRKGLYEAHAYVNAHRAETVDTVVKFTGYPAETVRKMQRVTMGLSLDPKLIEPMLDAGVRYKVIPHTFDVKEMCDPAALTTT